MWLNDVRAYRVSAEFEMTYQRACLSFTVIPNFSVNCRRLTPAPGYLRSLAEGKVSVLPLASTLSAL